MLGSVHIHPFSFQKWTPNIGKNTTKVASFSLMKKSLNRKSYISLTEGRTSFTTFKELELLSHSEIE